MSEEERYEAIAALARRVWPEWSLSERTPEAIADKLEALLSKDPCVDFGAETEAEAEALAGELRQRGWKVSVGAALLWPKGDKPARLVDLVTVSGKATS